jgi:putative ABC transport system substrate-binding protein
MAGREPSHPIARAFVRELRALGYVEGQNLVLERRSAEGHPERLPAIMAELIRLPVDVIVTTAYSATGAAKQATSTIPIVMGISASPVELGFAASLARPGGNVTGLTWNTGPEIAGKWLELLKEAAPGVSRVAVIHQTSQLPAPLGDQYKEMHVAARVLGVTLLSVVVEDPDRLPDALAAITRERAEALLVAGSAWNFTYRHRLVDLAAKSRLPAIYSDREYVKGGGLMSYGIRVTDLMRRAAGYVDRILRGAKPADLPIEQPTTFDLVINLKTAKALGLTIPPSVLARADDVIQ